MRVFILIDETNIVQCVASEECNLHDDKLHMEKYHVEMGGIVGDEYNPTEESWIHRPENHPQPSEIEVNESKIQAEVLATTRAVAIQNLKDRGELKVNYRDKGV